MQFIMDIYYRSEYLGNYTWSHVPRISDRITLPNKISAKISGITWKTETFVILYTE